MLRVERKVYEKAVVQIITSTDPRDLIREFSLYRVFFYSLLKDISRGEDSPNYPILKKIARDRKINEQFIVDQAKFVLSQLAPDEPEEDYYKILDIPFMASAEEIRESWLNLVKAYHPDNVGERGLDITKKLNEAYSVLGDPVKRGRYDVRRLPALPIVVTSPWVKIPPKRFAYPFVLAVVACMLVLLVVKSNYFYPPVEENKLAKVGDKGPGKGVNTVKENSVEKSGKSLIQTSSPPSKPVMKESPPSGPKAEKMRTSLSSAVRRKDVLVAHATAGIEKTPEKEEKEPLQQELLQQERLPKDELKPEGGSYVVERGDSLWKIADRFKVSVRELRDANDLKGNSIAVGQALIIPQAGYKEETEKEIKATGQHVAVSDKGEEPKLADKKTQEESQVKAVKPMTFSTNKELAVKTQEKLQTKAFRPKAVMPFEPEKSESVSTREETASIPYPDEESLYSFVSQYVSAYTNRDITTFMSLFEPDAKENGVEISKTRKSYMDNFSSLEIIKYSVKIRDVDLKGDSAFTFADFDLTFREKNDGEVKNTNGEIVWLLSWRNNHWRIKEINYKIKDVESLGG